MERVVLPCQSIEWKEAIKWGFSQYLNENILISDDDDDDDDDDEEEEDEEDDDDDDDDASCDDNFEDENAQIHKASNHFLPLLLMHHTYLKNTSNQVTLNNWPWNFSGYQLLVRQISSRCSELIRGKWPPLAFI